MTVHFHGAFRKGWRSELPACGQQKGVQIIKTEEPGHVTCKRCQKVMASLPREKIRTAA